MKGGVEPEREERRGTRREEAEGARHGASRDEAREQSVAEQNG